MRTRRDAEDGFTLVELLTVMMIISVLAAIALPLLHSQREKALRASMSSDLHSLVLSETAWSSANNGAYTADPTLLKPEGYNPTRNVTGHVKLVGQGFVACTKHSDVSKWLIYTSGTSTFTSSATDCA